MKFSEHWLREWVNPALDTQALCHLLTMAGLEVEDTEPAAPPFTGVVVAEVKSVVKHPNADRLRVCQVDAGTGELVQIVCGAPNVAEGVRVPCALPGDAEVLSDLTQGEVIVVILAQHLALFLREHLAVKVEQIPHFQIFCHCR